MILDPHGDYLGFWEKRHLFADNRIKLYYPNVHSPAVASKRPPPVWNPCPTSGVKLDDPSTRGVANVWTTHIPRPR